MAGGKLSFSKKRSSCQAKETVGIPASSRTLREDRENAAGGLFGYEETTRKRTDRGFFI